MREIKFRAYNSDWKMMVQPDEIISLNVDGVSNQVVDVRFWIKTTDGQLHDNIWEDDRYVTLMQYTGLKDKNGKEIYEGDIVLFVEDVIVETIEGHHRTEPEGNIGAVKFEKGAYYIQTLGNTNDFYSWGEQQFSWEELEVIGNIYENPELIKS